jgi:hypothetical protein
MDKRILTNPVLCFNYWLFHYFREYNPLASQKAAAKKLSEWIEAGIELPLNAIEDYRARGYLPLALKMTTQRPPRVVGLVFDDHDQIGLVDPLKTRCATHSTHSTLLPFTAPIIQSLLIRVCEELAPQIPGALPEIVGFEFGDSLQEPINGSSMDIAGLLSALDALAEEQCELFAACCAVVEPGSDGTLRPVGRLTEKLDAFLREFGRGSLLVVSPETALEPRFLAAFDAKWRVSSIPMLAQRIVQIPIIASRLTHRDPINPRQMGLLLSRLRLLDEERADDHVIRLCERVAQNDYDGAVPLRDRARVQKYHYDSLRHRGQHGKSLGVVKHLEPTIKQLGSAISWDEELQYVIDQAAAFFDSCDFHCAFAQLEDWMTRCNEDPRRFSSQLRVELFNTLGRCSIMLGDGRFEHLFRESIRLQEQVDPANIRRTESYLIHGLLRADRHDEADVLIERHEANPTGDNLADGFTRFYRCELERRRGNVRPASEEDLPQDWDGYTRAFALQAMGRQHGRETSQAVELLKIAVDILESESGNDDYNILALIARVLKLSWASIAGDAALWRKSTEWIRQRVHQLGNAQQCWFADAIDELGCEPETERAEELILRTPYL